MKVLNKLNKIIITKHIKVHILYVIISIRFNNNILSLDLKVTEKTIYSK